MARLTVNQIMTMIASSVNQQADAPTAGGDEYNLWLEYINRSVQEWTEAADWNDLRKVFNPTISGISQATVSLPQDFKRLAGPPKHWGTGVAGGEDWPVIVPEEKSLYSSNDKYVYTQGNVADGYSLLWNPTTLASGASLEIPYYSVPTSLASPAQVPLVPDSQFIVDRTIAYILEARSDPRFQQSETKAREKLLQMVSYNDSDRYNSYAGAGNTYVKNHTRNLGFRFGRD